MAKGGAIAGGALGGAGTGAAIGSVVPGLGTAAGAIVGGLVGGASGLFSSNDEENKAKQQMMMRAADQRAAPWLSKLGVAVKPQDAVMADSHSTDLLQGALSGFQQYQAGEKTKSDNDMREAMKQMLLGNTDGGKQAAAIGKMAPIGSVDPSSINDSTLQAYLSQMGTA